MKICVYGLWHLGSVTAACLSDYHEITGIDPNSEVIVKLSEGTPPIFEPGLTELIRKRIESKRLQFSTNLDSVKSADVVWVTFDTTVNDKDEADVKSVIKHIEELFPYFSNGTVVLISSQVPVGTTAIIEKKFDAVSAGRHVDFAFSPENLRLGKAIDLFRHPGRIIIGTRSREARTRIEKMLVPFKYVIEWMGVESAEMTKHALNSFLAMCVTFINEIASICESVGADAKEIERGLKTEKRIGQAAYLSPGGAFGGGHLARDITFMLEIAATNGLPLPVFSGIKRSNDFHKTWMQRRLDALMTDGLIGKTIAVLGLTYTPNTNTLHGSESVALCQWLIERGAIVRAYDPEIGAARQSELPTKLIIANDMVNATVDADAIIVMIGCPVFRELKIVGEKRPLLLDANRFLSQFATDSSVRYITVG